MSSREITFAAAGATTPTYIEDVFSTWLYTGNGSTQTITNGIDLAGKGGMVWAKTRSNNSYHGVSGPDFLTAYLGTPGGLRTNQNTALGATDFSGVSSTGFNLAYVGGDMNMSGWTYASWTFRKAPKFFDVVTYTGNGVAGRTVAHNLGSVPGMIIVKCTSVADDWAVYHRSTGATQFAYLNDSGPFYTGSTVWNNTAPTSTQFTVGTFSGVNANGRTYVAYLFAHDAGGFGTAGTDNVISCGSFTASSAVTDINLGYEPQWILIKRSDSAAGPVGWYIYDSMRGMPVDLGTSSGLRADTTSAEAVTGSFGPAPTATGFQYLDALTTPATFIYMAIRRGPMKTPTSGTSVFSPVTSSGTTGTQLTTNFPIDSQWINYRTGAAENTAFNDRLRGNSSTTTSSGNILISSSTAAESSVATTRSWDNTGFQVPSYYSGGSTIYWNFRRAPGFFDEVCYTGTGTTQNITHNLGVAPELIIIKRRTSTWEWTVYAAPLGNNREIYLNYTNASSTTSVWNNTTPTASVFTVSTAYQAINESGAPYVAYLFASLAGVSKVGSYTGTGGTQTINAGLPTGARFVLIKRTDSTGDWFVWDTARGMVAGTDPRLALNSTAAETNANWVYTTTNGFQIVTTDASVNANGGTYIYLAIA